MADVKKIKPFFFGEYEVIGILGSGLAGKVYLAKHRTSRKPVALKQLHPGAEKLIRDYFLNEQSLVRKAQHPNILRYVEGSASEGHCFLITEFVEGTRLDHLLGKPIDPATTIQIVEQLARALDYLHENHPDHPVIHCDVKPSNIVITDEGSAILLDLSSARTRFFIPGEDAPLLSSRYSSPEQFSRQPTPQSDQYALAIIAVELLTGKPLFPKEHQRRSLEDAQQVTESLATRLPSTMTATVTVLKRALDWLPDNRYLSCRVFAARLEAALREDGFLGKFDKSVVVKSVEKRAAELQRARWLQLGVIVGVVLAAFVSLLAIVQLPGATLAQVSVSAATATVIPTTTPVTTALPLIDTLPTATLSMEIIPLATPTTPATPTSEPTNTPAVVQPTVRPTTRPTLRPTRVPPTVRPTRVPPKPQPGIVMPNLVGYGENQAKDILAGLGITSVIVDYQSRSHVGALFDQYPAYSVLSSSPGAGSRIQPGSTVVLGIRSPQDDSLP